MFSEKLEPFKKKVWLATPAMHGEEMKNVTEAYETNWMSTVGANINEFEKLAVSAELDRCIIGTTETVA